MTQYDRIRQYMIDWGSITPMDAFRDLGITKLSTRIGEMIAAGEKIKKETEHGENRYGEKTHWAKYTLIREAGL